MYFQRKIVHGSAVCGVSHCAVKECFDLIDALKFYYCFIISYRFSSFFYAESLRIMKKIVTHKTSKFIVFDETLKAL